MPWLLTVAQVSEITHRTEAAIRFAIRRGKLRASDPKAGLTVVSRAAVADWLGLDVEDIRISCSSPFPGDAEAANAA